LKFFRVFNALIFILLTCILTGQQIRIESQVRLGFQPLGITQDQSGNFYLIDKSTLEIVVTDPDGNELKRTGGGGFGTSALIDPACIFWRGMNLYILDRGAKSVKLFDRLLNFRGEQKLEHIFTSAGVADPVSFTVNSFGEIFIADRLSHIILTADQYFKERGNVYFIENLPERKLNYPVKIFSDKDHIAVQDSAGLFLFDRFLNYISFFELEKTEFLAGFAGEYLILTKKNTVILRNVAKPFMSPLVFQIPGHDGDTIQSPFLINNRLIYITGRNLNIINTDTLLNEQ